jgi:hypothetical protein
MSIALVRSRLVSAVTPPEDIPPDCVLITAWTRDSTVRAVLTSFPFSGPATRTRDLGNGPSDAETVDEHLRADADVTEARWLSIADVIVRGEYLAPEHGKRRLSSIFAHYPACVVAAVVGTGDQCTLGGREGWSTGVVGQTAAWATNSQMFVWFASFAHFWTVSGWPPSALASAYVTIAGQSAALGADSPRRVAVIRPSV